MSRNGLTITIVFLAESANYGEGVGNISTLKKMTRGNYEQYSYISRQALRYNMIQQLGWDTTPVDGKSGVVQFAPSASIVDYPEIDLFGYMKTSSKEDDKKGGAMTRSAVVRLSNAVALEPYKSDLEFLTNMGLARRQNLENGIAQSEIHRSLYTYTITIDLDRIGVDGDINIPSEEKADRVKKFLDTVMFLYRDIKGRRENLSPVFVVGGRYSRKNPFFENRIVVEDSRLNVGLISEVINSNDDIKDNTMTGVMSGIFTNDKEIKDVFDYRYMIKDEYIEVLIRKSYGEEWLLEIEKDYDDDLGVEFENGLMSDYRSCTNKCIFCFIDQMPPGMRETLYFKDDDSRLSFL